MSIRPWLPWYPSDWLGSARARLLTSAQRGIYADLLSVQWDMETLPDKPDQCRCWCAFDAKVADVALVLDRFFALVPGGRQNEKMASLRTGAIALHDARAAAGKKGGESKPPSNGQANSQAKPKQNESKAEANPEHARASPPPSSPSQSSPPPSPPPFPQSGGEATPLLSAGADEREIPKPRRSRSPAKPRPPRDPEPHIDFARSWRDRLELARSQAGADRLRPQTANALERDAREFRLLVSDLAGDLVTAQRAADWVLADPFWRGAIGSLSGLRKNWDAIQGARVKANGSAVHPRTAANLNAVEQARREFHAAQEAASGR